jgi:hypothetical protein
MDPSPTFRKRGWRCLLALILWLGSGSAVRAEGWAGELAKMPLAQAVSELNRSNAVPLMLGAFKENATIKAFIFMPGATDELYFFDRDVAKLTNTAPTLLDAVRAYTNQTRMVATFAAPFLLLHTREDFLEEKITVEHPRTAEKLAKKKFGSHTLYDDAPWPVLKKDYGFAMNVFMMPEAQADSANHFYRHTFAGWNLNGLEALNAVALAGKTVVTIRRGKLAFESDARFNERPDGSAKRAQQLMERR